MLFPKKILPTAIFLFLASQLLELLAVWLVGGHYAGLCAWDCAWYASIVREGYDLVPHAHPNGDAANWAFFPALPALAAMLNQLVPWSPEVSLIVTGKLFFLASIASFIRFVRAYNPDISPVFAGAVVALNPYAIYGNTGYTESLFLFLTCMAFCNLKQGHHVVAGGFGALLGATRFVGIVFLFSYLIGAARNIKLSGEQRPTNIVLGAMLVPLGLCVFMAYLHFHMGDALAFMHIQKAWNRLPQNPLVHIREGFNGGRLYLLWVGMTLSALMLALVLYLQKRWEFAAFSFFCTIIPLSTALWSMPRYIWWQAPLLLVLVEIISKKRLWMLVVPLFIGWSFFMYRSWFHGMWFVV